jgi:hypothetical protein
LPFPAWAQCEPTAYHASEIPAPHRTAPLGISTVDPINSKNPAAKKKKPRMRALSALREIYFYFLSAVQPDPRPPPKTSLLGWG